MTGGAWIILAAVAAGPLGLVAWVRWRFGARQMNARADQLNADAKARMQKLDDAALAALFEGLGSSTRGAAHSRPPRRETLRRAAARMGRPVA